MKLYVASSWRNLNQPSIVETLRAAGHEVYDFRNPPHGRGGFAWSDIDPDWQTWTPLEYREALNHPVAKGGFGSDWEGMTWADAGVLVMPCGRSAHIEAGYFVGAGKPLFILLSEGEPELMYKMATALVLGVPELLEEIARAEGSRLRPPEGMVFAPARCSSCLTLFDAPTTGLLMRTCHCGGILSSVFGRHVQLPWQVANG